MPLSRTNLRGMGSGATTRQSKPIATRTTPQRMACGILSPQDIPPESDPASDPQSEHVVGQPVMGPTAESVAVSLASDPFLTARHTGSDSRLSCIWPCCTPPWCAKLTMGHTQHVKELHRLYSGPCKLEQNSPVSNKAELGPPCSNLAVKGPIPQCPRATPSSLESRLLPRKVSRHPGTCVAPVCVHCANFLGRMPMLCSQWAVFGPLHRQKHNIEPSNVVPIVVLDTSRSSWPDQTIGISSLCYESCFVTAAHPK